MHSVKHILSANELSPDGSSPDGSSPDGSSPDVSSHWDLQSNKSSPVMPSFSHFCRHRALLSMELSVFDFFDFFESSSSSSPPSSSSSLPYFLSNESELQSSPSEQHSLQSDLQSSALLVSRELGQLSSMQSFDKK